MLENPEYEQNLEITLQEDQIYKHECFIWIPTQDLALRIVIGGHCAYDSTLRVTESCYHCMVSHPAELDGTL